MSVYAIASGKGGVGKTTTAIALAACAGAAGERAVVVDADLGMADVGTFLGLDDGVTLHDVLAGDAAVEVAADLRERYDVVVLDAGAGLSHDTVLPLGLADEVVLVSTPDEVSVLDTDKTREMAERVGGRLRGIVFTKAVEADLDDLSDGIGVDLLGVIPADDAVGEAAAARESVPAFAPGSPAGTAYMDLAATLFELPVTSISFADESGGNGIEAAAVEPFPGEEDEEATAEAESGGDEDAPDAAGAESGGSEAAPDAEARDSDLEDSEADGEETDSGGGFLSWLFGR
ncbi:MAG: MinD/ParA family protein [Halobacteriaceae archaeon]